MATVPQSLLDLEPVKLAGLVQEGAEAVQAGLAHIANLEKTRDKQAADNQALTARNAELEAQLNQAKAATARTVNITREQAEKYASVLVLHRVIAPADKEASINSMLSDPSKIANVLDTVTTLLPPPAAGRDGSPRQKSATDLASGADAPKERWY